MLQTEDEQLTQLEDFTPEFTDDEMAELTGLLHFPGGNDDCEIIITTTEEEQELDQQAEASANFGDDLSDLDALLGESLELRKGKFEVSAARKALRRNNHTGTERALLMAIVSRWEIAREWEVEGQDAVFEAQRCACCGNIQHHFLGVFQRQKSKAEPNCYRWLSSDHASYVTAELSRGIKEDFSEVPMCIKCSVKQGWGVIL